MSEFDDIAIKVNPYIPDIHFYIMVIVIIIFAFIVGSVIGEWLYPIDEDDEYED